MDLKIGILDLTPAWQIILDQLGLYYQLVDDHTLLKPENYAVLIVNFEIDKTIIHGYLENGGAVLYTSGAYAKIYNTQTHFKRKKYIISDKDSNFANIGIIDLVSNISYLKDVDLELVDKGLNIHSGVSGRGIFYILSIDVDQEILNYSDSRRKFPAVREELPSEIVAKVSKAKIRRLIQILLIELHDYRNLPFIQKSFIPGNSGIFIFRIDTDFCTVEEAKALLSVCRKHHIKATWFVDSQNEERLADFYAKLNDQEVGLHCYRHLVFDNYNDNYENIKKGLDNLNRNEIEVNGFAAPFGSWNRFLNDALEKLDFYYSSEFVPSYDDLPYHIYYNKHFSEILQIPIHPLSAGRLRRSHFSETEMMDYYKMIIDRKLVLHEPIIFYHHPHHRLLNVFDQLFSYVNKLNLKNIAMIEYAQWWRKRNDIELKFTLKDNEIEFSKENVEINVYHNNGFSNSTSQKNIEISSLGLTKVENIDPLPNERLSRKFHWRDLLYKYESWKARRNR